MEILNVTIGGMHCESCARALSASLGVLDGVQSVDAQPDTGRTTVLYDPRKAQPAVIHSQIKNCGFEILGE